MSTESRLNKLFQTSPVIPCDCLSRFVIMSDCHREWQGRSEIIYSNGFLWT